VTVIGTPVNAAPVQQAIGGLTCRACGAIFERAKFREQRKVHVFPDDKLRLKRKLKVII